MSSNELEKRQLGRALKSSVNNIVGVTLPFIVALIPIVTLGRFDSFLSFLDEGQFFLFGAGLFTTSHFLLNENGSCLSMRRDKVMKELSLWLLIICSGFYATLYSIKMVDYASDWDRVLVRVSSVMLYLISLWSCYRSIRVDMIKKDVPIVDVKEESRKSVDNIMSQL